MNLLAFTFAKQVTEQMVQGVSNFEALVSLLTLLLLAIALFIAIRSVLLFFERTPKSLVYVTVAVIAIVSLALVLVNPDQAIPGLSHAISVVLISTAKVVAWIQLLAGTAGRLFA